MNNSINTLLSDVYIQKKFLKNSVLNTVIIYKYIVNKYNEMKHHYNKRHYATVNSIYKNCIDHINVKLELYHILENNDE